MLRKIGQVSWANRLAVIYSDREWEEYRVRLFQSGAYVAGADYHTDDLSDAHHTANRMVGLTSREN